MRRVAFAILTITAAGAQQSDVLRWTKTLAPGVTYTEEVRLNDPLVIHALRFRYPAEGIRFETRIAQDTIYPRTTTARETVDQMAKRVGAFAAVNADFFGWDGDPLGLQVTRGEFVSEPYSPRAAVAWSNSALLFDAPRWMGSLQMPDGAWYAIDGVNRSCKANEAILNTAKAGVASSKDPCYVFLFETDGPLTAGKDATLTLKNIFPETYNFPLQEKDAVLMVSAQRAPQYLAAFKVGDTCKAKMELMGKINWKAIDEAIGGGPRIVKDGKPYITPDYEKFDRSYSARHPRTALGYTSTGEVVLCVVDGRTAVSRGVTFEELAAIMLRFGCADAINLDGGGSSTLYVGGAVLNRPSDGSPRPVANALLLFLPAAESPPKLAIAAKPGPLAPGDATTLTLNDDKGIAIPNAEVLWSASGAAAWVDAGGTVRALAEGKTRVHAFARGAEATLDLEISKTKPRLEPSPR